MAFVVLGIGIVFIILAITVLRIHPFLALILAAFLVGILSPVHPRLQDELRDRETLLRESLERGEIDPERFEERLEALRRDTRAELQREAESPGRQAVEALELTTESLGSTAASIAVVIALAALIGQCLMESGAADKITLTLLRWLGERRAPEALLASGYVLSVPVFFDTVFFLLVPLARSVAAKTKRHYVVYIVAVAAGAVITHSLVPPTPGPLLMVDALAPFGLNLGIAIFFGFLMGLLPAALALTFARWIGRRLKIQLRPMAGGEDEEKRSLAAASEEQLPGLLASILPIALPIAMITGSSLVELLHDYGVIAGPAWFLGWSAFVGNKNLALLAGTVAAMGLLVRHSSVSLRQLSERLEPAFQSAGVIILITSAGGAFGAMLARTGLSESLSRGIGGEAAGGLGLITLAWLLSVTMKTAQGSGTVAMITASAMMAELLSGGGALPCHPLYLFAAIGFGSMVVSWMNDSGFWVVCKMSGFSETETLKTWTAGLILIGTFGLLQTLLLFLLFPGV